MFALKTEYLRGFAVTNWCYCSHFCLTTASSSGAKHHGCNGLVASSSFRQDRSPLHEKGRGRLFTELSKNTIEAWHTVGWYHVHGGSMILRIIDGLGLCRRGADEQRATAEVRSMNWPKYVGRVRAGCCGSCDYLERSLDDWDCRQEAQLAKA
jgi:hypothetical protein